MINAGHTKFGSGTGAIKYLRESIETRKIAYEVMKLLADTEHEVIPAVFDRHENNLKEAVETANLNDADMFISIHLNAAGGNGVEVYTWKAQQNALAKKVCENIHKLGFKNRGLKDGSKLYVIRNTKCTAILIECCFVDSEIDTKLYDMQKIAYAIYSAIME